LFNKNRTVKILIHILRSKFVMIRSFDLDAIDVSKA